MIAILSRKGFDRGMLEYVIGVCNIIAVLLLGLLINKKLNLSIQELKQTSSQTQANLNHVAEAIIGLSDLLDEADQVIENISAVPTVGEILQQALQGFIASKLTPMLPDPLKDVPTELIKAKSNPDVQWQEAEVKRKQQDANINQQ